MTPRIAVFDQFPGEYDAWFDTYPEVYARQIRILRAFIAENGTGLEIGVGSGRFASLLGIRHGLDPSLPLLAMARQRGVEPVAGLGECLPYRSGSFDQVLMMTVICYMDEYSRSFREAHRVLKPGGSLVVGFLEPGGEIAERERAREPKGRFLRYAVFHPAVEVMAVLAGAGFSGISLVYHQNGFCIVTARKE